MSQSLSSSYDTLYQDDVVELQKLDFCWPTYREEAVIKWSGSGERLLELGFGRGTVLYNLRERFHALFGIEMSPVRTHQAQRAFKSKDVSNIHLMVGNVEKGLPFPDKYFDCIVWADVIEHVIDVWAAMKEIERLLGTKGTLITSTPNIAEFRRRLLLLAGFFPSTSGKKEGLSVRRGELFDGGHMHYFTFSSLEKLYQKYGIRPLRRYGFGNLRCFHNICPSLLSGSVFVIGEKR